MPSRKKNVFLQPRKLCFQLRDICTQVGDICFQLVDTCLQVRYKTFPESKKQITREPRKYLSKDYAKLRFTRDVRGDGRRQEAEGQRRRQRAENQVQTRLHQRHQLQARPTAVAADEPGGHLRTDTDRRRSASQTQRQPRRAHPQSPRRHRQTGLHDPQRLCRCHQPEPLNGIEGPPATSQRPHVGHHHTRHPLTQNLDSSCK